MIPHITRTYYNPLCDPHYARLPKLERAIYEFQMARRILGKPAYSTYIAEYYVERGYMA